MLDRAGGQKNAILVMEYADRLFFNEQGASLMDAAIRPPNCVRGRSS